MTCAPKILIFDDHRGGPPIVDALRAKFPEAELDVFEDADAVCAKMRANAFTVVVTHHTKAPGLSLVWRIRDADPFTPVILVSDVHRRESARAAGANELLPCSEWQRIGAVVELVLARQNSAEPMHHQCA